MDRGYWLFRGLDDNCGCVWGGGGGGGFLAGFHFCVGFLDFGVVDEVFFYLDDWRRGVLAGVL